METLAHTTGLSLANRLQHLQHLRQAGLVTAQRDGRQMLYRLPRDQRIVAYCRGPYCVFSHEAVQRLRRLGVRVRRYEEGFPEWKAAGLPTA